MKVIFLDIDGVLNSRRYDEERIPGTSFNIDETRLPLVKEIVDKTSALIVLSSTWRHKLYENIRPRNGEGTRLLMIFEKYSLKISYITPDVGKLASRPSEISAWLAERGDEVEAFAILDDAFGGWGALSDHLVKTDYRIGRGLERRHVDAAIALLNAENDAQRK